MNSLVVLQDNQAVTTSLQIAEVFKKNHRDVLKAIDDLNNGLAQNFATLFREDKYVHMQNKQSYRMFYLNRDGFSLLAMGFTGKDALRFKMQFIKTFNEMEAAIKHQVQIPSNPMQALELMFTALKDSSEEVKAIDSRVVELEENVLLSAADYSTIGKSVGQRVNQVIRERKLILDERQRKELYKDINGSIKKITGARNRANLRAKHYEMVYEFILDWQPSTATLTIIKKMEV